MRKRDRSLFSNAVGLLICGLLAGVVVAAAAFPAVAMTGLAAKAGADAFDGLPSDLVVQQSPQISYLLASDGKTRITSFYDENRKDVPISEVADIMQKAMVASEDTRFYEHNGVDVKGVVRAFVNNQSGGQSRQGASTLTMQYVRQAQEYSATDPQQIVDATSDTSGRKVREMRYALALEKQLTKKQILERYLNIAPFGNGAFGVYAASEVYFGKAPRDLDLAQASLLAGLVQAPTTYDPLTADGLKKSTDRRDNYVLPNMVKMGYITDTERKAAIAEKLTFSGASTPNACADVANNSWGFFCDQFERWWMEQTAFGADPYERLNRLKSGGYTIISSLDVGEQAAAVKNVNKQAKALKPSDALMLAGVEPGSGHIKIMAVNRKYSNDQSHNGKNTDPAKASAHVPGNWPNTTLPLISGGGDVNGYQFGSTFKMFTMLAALKQGLPLATTINAPYQFVSDYRVGPGPATCQGNHYCPTNSSKSEQGTYNMWSGFGHSVNTFFVSLEQRIGAQNAVAMAKSLGIQFRAHGTKQNPSDYELANTPAYAADWGAFTLGVAAVTPLDMANAYATVAADGKFCKALPVMSIQDFGGNKLAAGDPQCTQAVPVDVARAAADAARCPVGDSPAFGDCAGGGTATPTHGRVDKPVAGKTGTTDNDKTAALIVMTKQLAIAGILADPDNSRASYSRHYSHDQVNAAVQYTLHDAMIGKPSKNFTAPSHAIAYGNQVSMPGVTCKSVAEATATLKGDGFTVSVSGTQVTSTCPAGTVAKTDPSGHNVKGGAVTLYLSSGAAPPTGTNPPNGNGGNNNGGGGNGGHGGGNPPNR
jgi:membrane peptidoglycan carboxypeptidase